jgi:peroxiredoxin Q/BCP
MLPARGEPAPAFTAITDAGARLTLDELRGSWVILFFYPKDDTPG